MIEIIVKLDVYHYGAKSKERIERTLKEAIHKENLLTTGIGSLYKAKVIGVTEDFVPLAEYMDSTQRITDLESMRPEWAKGYTSDSVAAQSSVAAKLQLWNLLGVSDQTEAVDKLKQFINRVI